MNITKGTIIRTGVLLLAIANYFLKSAGYDVITLSEGQIGDMVEAIITVAAIGASWWKNNSFSQSAREADAFLQMLKNPESDGLE